MPVLDLPAGGMYFERTGRGRPGLVFAHGAACNHEDWHLVLPVLADRYSMAAVDLRGYGESTTMSADTCGIGPFAQDLVGLVRHLGWEPAVLIGHSMSCRVVLQAAADYPDAVAGVVIVDTTITARSPDELASRRATRYGDDYPEGSIARFVEMLGAGVPVEERDRVLAHVRRVPRDVAEAVAMSAWVWDAQHLDDTVARIEAPVLAIQTTAMNGSRRRSLDPGEAPPGLDPLRAGPAAFETVVLPGMNHFPMLEAPDQVAAQIASFVEQL